MKQTPRLTIKLGLSALCLTTASFSAFSQNVQPAPSSYDFLPLPPRLSILGLGGDNEVINGDGMVALAGNENGIWFLDGQGKTAFQSSWVASLGTGIRIPQEDKRILGAYLFGDYNTSGSDKNYWFVSPGLESMGQLMDFRLNGYIPVGTQRNFVSSGFADNFGNYDYVSFSGHNQYDAIVNNYEEVGWGFDGEAGIRLAKLAGLRLYAGGYHFNMQNTNDINGVSGRIQVPVNSHIEFNVRDSYDNEQHNTIELGIRFTIGGVNKSPRSSYQPIRERLLDPIERNLATLGQGTAEPVAKEQEVVNPDNPLVLERSNIWFFSPTGTDTFEDSSSCTAENPCVNTDFTQSTIDAINAGPDSPVNVYPFPSSDPSFYLAPGQYSILNNGSPFVFTDDSVYGRSANFFQPEQSAFLNGAAIVNGDDLFDSVIFQNDPQFNQAVGLTLNPDSNLSLTNTIVGTDESLRGYANAINMNSASLFTYNSEIHSYSDTADVSSIGINTESGTNSITLVNTLVKSSANLSVTPSTAEFVTAAGINLNSPGSNTVVLQGSTIDTTTHAAATINLDNAIDSAGIFIDQGATGQNNIILKNQSVINATGDFNLTGDGSAYVFGIKNIANDIDQTTNITVNNSAINSTLDGAMPLGNLIVGAVSSSAPNNVMQFNDSEITVANNALANEAAAFGILSVGTNTINLSDTDVSVDQTNDQTSSGSATGIQIDGAATDVETVSLVNSSLEINGTSASSGLTNGIRIQRADTANVFLDNSSININDSVSNGSVTANGIYVSGINTAEVTLQNQSSVDVQGNTDTGDLFIYGIQNFAIQNSSTVNIINSDINVEADANNSAQATANAILVNSQNASTINVTGDQTHDITATVNIENASDFGFYFARDILVVSGQGDFQSSAITVKNMNLDSTVNVETASGSAEVTAQNVGQLSGSNNSIDIEQSTLNAAGAINQGQNDSPYTIRVINIGGAQSTINVINSTLNRAAVLDPTITAPDGYYLIDLYGISTPPTSTINTSNTVFTNSITAPNGAIVNNQDISQ